MPKLIWLISVCEYCSTIETRTFASPYKDMDLGYRGIFCDLEQQCRTQHSRRPSEENMSCSEGELEWIPIFHSHPQIDRDSRRIKEKGLFKRLE